MSARTTLVIKDRAATPADHTFTPDGDDLNGVHVFSEKTGVPAGNAKFTAALKNTNGKYRPSLRLQVPITATQVINGVSSPVVIRNAYVELSCTFDETSTEQERKDAVGLMANAMAASQTQINDLLTGLSDIY